MVWDAHEEIWDKMYAYAKEYYKQNGNLEMPSDYTIKIPNEEKPIPLGSWIKTQRQSYKNEELIKQGKTLKKGAVRITEEHIKLLNAIGMRWDVHEEEWNKMYGYAKKYYEVNDNLNVPQSYTIKISNEEKLISLGVWISRQRTAYKNEELIKHGLTPKSGDRISKEHIELLDAIGMRWLPKKKYKQAKDEFNTEIEKKDVNEYGRKI